MRVWILTVILLCGCIDMQGQASSASTPESSPKDQASPQDSFSSQTSPSSTPAVFPKDSPTTSPSASPAPIACCQLYCKSGKTPCRQTTKEGCNLNNPEVKKACAEHSKAPTWDSSKKCAYTYNSQGEIASSECISNELGCCWILCPSGTITCRNTKKADCSTSASSWINSGEKKVCSGTASSTIFSQDGICDMIEQPTGGLLGRCRGCIKDPFNPTTGKCLSTFCTADGECCDPVRRTDCTMDNTCKCQKPCDEDIECMKCVLASEAFNRKYWGTNKGCLRAIAWVIFNRKDGGAFGDSICDVVKASGEFTGVEECKCSEEPSITPKDMDTWCACCRNRDFTAVNGEGDYQELCRWVNSWWASGRPPGAQVKANRFRSDGKLWDDCPAKNEVELPKGEECGSFKFYNCPSPKVNY